MKSFRIAPEFILRNLNGKHLLMVYPQNGGSPYALEVNDSFAKLFKAVSGRDDFATSDLEAVLMEEYQLSPDTAAEETRKILDLWDEQGLLQ